MRDHEHNDDLNFVLIFVLLMGIIFFALDSRKIRKNQKKFRSFVIGEANAKLKQRDAALIDECRCSQ